MMILHGYLFLLCVEAKINTKQLDMPNKAIPGEAIPHNLHRCPLFSNNGRLLFRFLFLLSFEADYLNYHFYF